jgi:hypothetical protein
MSDKVTIRFLLAFMSYGVSQAFPDGHEDGRPHQTHGGVTYVAKCVCFQLPTVGSKSTVVAKYEALAVYTIKMISAIHICELVRWLYSWRGTA